VNKKKLILGTLFVGAGLALARKLFATTSLAGIVHNGTDFGAIDTYVEQQMKRLQIPGLSLGIIEGDKIVHLRGFGKICPGGEVPTSQTPFFIGSLTKSFTALAVMQLVEAGKVELDAPVQKYIPWFRVADPRASAQTPALAPERSAGASVTVRHLLNQTSGLPYFASGIAQANFTEDPAAIERQVRAFSTLKLAHPVGSKCNYSNFNYIILGLVIEAASGESYADYIQSHIFTPLAMSHSYTSKALAKQNGLAMGYRHWFSIPFPAPDLPLLLGSLPSGWLISCAEDMAHYLIAHLNGGCYNDTRILSGAGIDELHRGVKEYGKFGLGGLYGMGWFEINLGQTKTFSHSGNVPDFSAFMALVPEQKKGIILLLNADPYGLPPITEELGMGVTALLAGQQSPPIRLDFIQWIMRSLPLIPLLQFAGVFTTLGRIRRWRAHPEHRPSCGRTWGQHILLPLIPNMTLAAILLYLRSTGLLQFLHQYMPDLAWIARVCGGFAAIWIFLRTGLILRALRKT
jgi:CubicO group peptidase (beta-lactamase class C family)